MATKIAIIYGQQSKVIRRVLVCDTDKELEAVSKTIPGESLMLLDRTEYDQLDGLQLKLRVAQDIGNPIEDRVVEIDSNGKVIGVYKADPLIDKPIFHKDNILEYHKDAIVGDQKVNGSFPTKPAMEPTTPEEAIGKDTVFGSGGAG